jgi:hypothetical protein
MGSTAGVGERITGSASRPRRRSPRGKEFDRIMGRALQVKPEVQKPKRATKTARKKRSASK